MIGHRKVGEGGGVENREGHVCDWKSARGHEQCIAVL